MNSSHTGRILVTGASGFLGYNLCLFLSKRHEVYGTFLSHPLSVPGCTCLPLDLTDRARVFQALAEVRPGCIIHAAALSMPDLCEREQARAWSINVEGTRHIVDAARDIGSRVVYISTDMVFDGERGQYRETDVPKPVNFYGETKLAGERIALSSAANCIVMRITLQYGYGHGAARSFSDWLLDTLRAGRQARLFADQYRTPTYVFDTARGLEHAAYSTDYAAVYHLAGPERIDRYTFGKQLARAYNFSENLLVKSAMRDIPGGAPRPRDVSLWADTFNRRFNFTPFTLSEGLRAMHDEKNH